MKKIFILVTALLIYPFLSFTTFINEKEEEKKEEKPNVLLIFTDQQNIEMMSAMGNPYLNTPNMDRLAKRGVMFKNAYTASPVCGPARASLITGRMPHETGVEWNGQGIKENIKNVGEIFREAGYQTIWGGKWHLPESYPQRAENTERTVKGFNLLPFGDPDKAISSLGTEADPPLTEAVLNFLNNNKKEDPFFLAISYHNPHDICFYPRKQGWVSETDSLLNVRFYGENWKLPEIIGTHPSKISNLPPLPANHPVSESEPDFLKDKRYSHKIYGVETHLAFLEFGDVEWQGYLNAYHRLTELVDLEIGKVLDALEENGLADNTIIVFTSDHGDGAGSHKWAAKLSLYDEASMVPMVVSYPGKIKFGKTDSTNLVSHIDVVPTLLDYAGIETKIPFTGKSMRTIIENQDASWRKYLVVELADFAPDKARKGRMLRTSKFKYNIFSQGERNEQLFHLKNDKGEMNNLAYEKEYKDIKDEHLKMLKDWIQRTNDSFEIPEK